MTMKDPAKLKKVSVNLPFGLGSAEWEADQTQRKAAWSLYVELVTRIAVQPLELDEGLLRETLTSLHSLFATTRQILKDAGPDVGASLNSVGGLAITILNKGIRPFLAKWHSCLQTWESQKPPQLSLKDHEEKWPQNLEMRKDIEHLRNNLEQYADALAIIAGVDCIKRGLYD
jgi:hypothetical protein